LAKIVQRQFPIGTDRNHSRYWIFSDVTPGLYVEKGTFMAFYAKMLLFKMVQ